MTSYVSRSGRVLALVVICVMLIAQAGDIIGNGIHSETWRGVGISSFVCILSWATLWYPKIVFTETVVDVRNVISRHIIEWGAVKRIDTKWGLTFVLENKNVSAWAAPAPGRHAAFTATRDRGNHLPETTYLAGTVRPGDLVTTDSGGAAALARRIWEKRNRDGGATATRANRLAIFLLCTSGVFAALAVLI